MAAAPLSPLRIVTSIALIVAGLFTIFLAQGLLADGDRTGTQTALMAVYGGAGLALFVAAVPLADGTRWACYLATAACAAVVVTWGALLATSGVTLGGAIAVASFAALTAGSLAARGGDNRATAQ